MSNVSPWSAIEGSTTPGVRSIEESCTSIFNCVRIDAVNLGEEIVP